MKASLRPGVSHTKRISIDRDRTISFMGEEALSMRHHGSSATSNTPAAIFFSNISMPARIR